MDIEQARATALEHRQITPEQFEKQLEILFINPHFGDIVTQVFPEVLDVHNKEGRDILNKYSGVAQFLEETKDVDDAKFLALRVETENSSWDGHRQKQQLRAISVRWYEGLRAEHFEAALTPNGKAIGVAIAHDAAVRTGGWEEVPITWSQPYAVVDGLRSSVKFTPWSQRPNELSSTGEFIYGANDREVFSEVGRLDQAYGLTLRSVTGIVTNLRRDMLAN